MSTSTADYKAKKSGTHSPANNAKRIRWVFTHQCEDEDGEADLDTFRSIQAERLIGAMIDHVDKFAFQMESAPTTGTKHFQGYFELENKKAFTWIKNNVLDFHYLAPSKGSPKQAWAYCTKQDSRVAGPWTIGEPTAAESGAQLKTELFVKAVMERKTDLELFQEHPSCMLRHCNGADRLRGCIIQKREKPLEVYLFFGPPGTGKTEFAYEQGELMGYDPYELPLGKDFWLTGDAYGKKYIILDEFKGNLALKDLLKFIGVLPQKVPVKGSFVPFCPEVIVITTNMSPWNWYAYVHRDFEREALFRRFTGAYVFLKNDEGVPRPVPIDLHDKNAFEAVMPKVDVPLLQQQATARMIAKGLSSIPLKKKAIKPIPPPVPYRYENGQLLPARIQPPPTVGWMQFPEEPMFTEDDLFM